MKLIVVSLTPIELSDSTNKITFHSLFSVDLICLNISSKIKENFCFTIIRVSVQVAKIFASFQPCCEVHGQRQSETERIQT